jgi:hypothetical protein
MIEPRRRESRKTGCLKGYLWKYLIKVVPRAIRCYCCLRINTFGKQLLIQGTGAMTLKRLAACALFIAAIQTTLAADWVNISDPLVASVAKTQAIPWPGNTSGVAVDRTTGTLYLDVDNVGIWQSTDHGQSFQRVAEGQISGRSEFGYSLNCDPAGQRMACFQLDGKGGLTLDGAQTWQTFAPMGRNWDYGAVDWKDPQARAMFASRHETGGEMYISSDAGASWHFIGKHPEFKALGIFDANTLVAGTDAGIVRSTDAGKTWTTNSTFHPVGRIAVYFKGRTYWLAHEGLITSRDKGQTWKLIGSPIEAGWGPLFGKDANHIILANFNDIVQSDNGGKTWTRIASMPPFQGGLVANLPGEYISIAWDPKANILYGSLMGSATYRLQLGH